jgi:hypothetical protein
MSRLVRRDLPLGIDLSAEDGTRLGLFEEA